MRVLLTTTTLVAAAPPTVTVAPAAKFVPVSVTAVPPAAGPDTGDTPVSVGAGRRGVGEAAGARRRLAARQRDPHVTRAGGAGRRHRRDRAWR